LISPNGLISVIQLTSKMLTMVRMQKNIWKKKNNFSFCFQSTQNFVTLLIKEESIMFDSLSYMLTDGFLTVLKKFVFNIYYSYINPCYLHLFKDVKLTKMKTSCLLGS
jgi:hypothetical protein